MIWSTTSFASIVVMVVGLAIIWANPFRNVNRGVFVCSLTVAAWLFFRHLATRREDALFWLRCTCAAGALIPASLWIVKDSILGDFEFSPRRFSLRKAGWIVLPVVLALLPFTDAFIPASSTEQERVRGPAYFAYYVGLLFNYGWLLRDALHRMKSLTGVRRMELQLWLGGGTIVAASIYALIGISAWFDDPTYRGLQPIAILLFYAMTVYAITSYRVFDARQILLIVIEKVILYGTVLAVAVAIEFAVRGFLSDIASLVIAVSSALAVAAVAKPWLERRFHFFPHAVLTRQAALELAQQERRPDRLEQSFRSLLQGWAQSERVVLLYGPADLTNAAGDRISADHLILSALNQLRWATPERLARERRTPARTAVAEYLASTGLALCVFENGPTVSVLVGLGPPPSRRPFTYPQVTQLQELASIATGAIERAHLSIKIRHAEQLATVGLLGASLAHEIRNPLVSIKTFVQLLPSRYQEPAFREKFFHLIADEVQRIDHLTEQLLDLASPRNYSTTQVELHPIIQASLALVATKALNRNVTIISELHANPDLVHTDGAAAKQVILNLCINAIQALENLEGQDRWARISTRCVPMGVEVSVSDNGPGISEDMLPRLFQPFQSTKSSGFGLGLAICRDILANLNATISLDPPVSGQGATFRVTFPCRPS